MHVTCQSLIELATSPQQTPPCTDLCSCKRFSVLLSPPKKVMTILQEGTYKAEDVYYAFSQADQQLAKLAARHSEVRCLLYL